MSKLTPFVPTEVYHIYNHAVSNEKLFLKPDNYYYFLRQYAKYTAALFETFAYCLLPNHFHIIIRVREKAQLFEHYKKKVKNPISNIEEVDFNNFITTQLSHFLNGYVQAFNKSCGRKGPLFIGNTERKYIDSDAYLSKVIHYVHFNAVHHNMVARPEDWVHSSYLAYLDIGKETRLAREVVFELFGGQEGFFAVHGKSLGNGLSGDFEH